MINYLIYGKIIIDKIRLKSGEITKDLLGGGGPQGAFGARLWDRSVGLLSRSGEDIPSSIVAELEALQVDLSGWQRYQNHKTSRSLMAYDENEYFVEKAKDKNDWLQDFEANLGALLREDLPIPLLYQSPKVIHLITEYTNETMSQTARKMKQNGTIFSLEPIIDYRFWTNREAMLRHFPEVDIISPDFPSASGIAETDNPRDVLKYWTKLDAPVVSIRHGMNGSYVWDREQDKMFHIPILKIEAKDPTGCGNSYGGGFAVGYEKFRDAKMAGCCGTISAAFVAQHIGTPAMLESYEEQACVLLDKLIDQVKEL